MEKWNKKGGRTQLNKVLTHYFCYNNHNSFFGRNELRVENLSLIKYVFIIVEKKKMLNT